MMQTLYQLADEYLAIAQQLADKDLPEEVIADTLEGASGDLEQKAWNIAALILQSEADAAAIKESEQRMSQRRKSLESRIDWMRDYLLVQLTRVGIAEIDSPEFVIRVRDNPPKAAITNEDAVPDTFKTTETVVTLRRAEIRKRLLDGEDVPGAQLERSQRLAIG